MQRVKTATAIAEKPPYSEGGTPGYFRSGNPVADIPATVPGQDWFNMVQEELIGMLLAAGLTPSSTDEGQLGSIVTTLLNSLALKAALASPTFTGNPVAPTPDQFDNDTSIATTAFVQRALGNLQGYRSLTAPSTLTAGDCGKRLHLAAAGGFATTLPLVSACAQGAKIIIGNGSGVAMTVQRQGADLLYTPLAATMTTLTLAPGDTLVLENNGGGWLIYGGSAALQYASGAFGASLAAAGYQKLPSGLIIQWGNWTANASAGAATAVTFPMTFPSAVYSVTLSANYTSTVTTTAWKDTLTTSGFNGHCSGVTGDSIHYIAIGK